MADPSTDSSTESHAVNQELNRILESPAFRGSERCKHFLQFVVHQTVDGKAESLKERVIGSEVFGRPPDYETAGDAIVRVKANEVRKRLAQYYAESSNHDALRIELPAGSYVPRFDRNLPDQSVPRPPAVANRPRFSKWLIGIGAALLLAASLWWLRPQKSSEFDQFWGPTLSGPGTPVIYLGTSTTYMVSGQLAQQLDAQHGVNPPKPILMSPGDIVRLSNYHVPLGNLYAVMQIAAVLQSKGKAAQIRPGGELKLDDISGRPVILIGGYSNPWTMQTNAKLRFRLDAWSIRDSMDPQRVWRMDKRFPWEPQTVDYAIVSRVWDPTSGSVFITAAGLNVFGTQAAGEFLTRPQYWKDLARHLPAGWSTKNLQVVLETNVVGTIPSTPKVAATYVW